MQPLSFNMKAFDKERFPMETKWVLRDSRLLVGGGLEPNVLVNLGCMPGDSFPAWLMDKTILTWNFSWRLGSKACMMTARLAIIRDWRVIRAENSLLSLPWCESQSWSTVCGWGESRDSLLTSGRLCRPVCHGPSGPPTCWCLRHVPPSRIQCKPPQAFSWGCQSPTNSFSLDDTHSTPTCTEVCGLSESYNDHDVLYFGIWSETKSIVLPSICTERG